MASRNDPRAIRRKAIDITGLSDKERRLTAALRKLFALGKQPNNA